MDLYYRYKENAIEKNMELLTSEEFFNESEMMKYKCNIHGIFESTPKFFKYTKYGCEKCSYVIRSKEYAENENNKKYNKNYFSEVFKSLEHMSNEYTIEYIANNRKVKLNCSKHGIFERFPHQLSETGCLDCRKEYKQSKKEEEKRNKIDKRKESNRNRAIKIDEIKKQLFEKFGDEYEYDFGDYKTKKSYITVKCKKHGKYKTQLSEYMNCTYGCRSCGNISTSIAERTWLDQNNVSVYQYKIKYNEKRYYYVDGFDEKTNTVYEYLGDFWHGNLKIYESDFLNKKNKKTMGELFDDTEKRFATISKLGYNIIYIWESSNKNIEFNGKLEI